MSDEFDVTSYLTSVQATNAVVDQLLAGAAMVAEGGVEGIQTAAALQPDLLLTVISSMAALIQKQRTELNGMVEFELKTLDELTELRTLIEEME